MVGNHWRSQLERAEAQLDQATLKELHQAILAGTGETDLEGIWLRGSVSFALGVVEEFKGEHAETYFNQAIMWLEQYIDRYPERSEVFRLLGESYGRLIRYRKGMEAMQLGPKAERHLQRACELDPHSAKAQFALGRAKLFTPRLFGGGPKEARRFLRKGMQLAPQDPEGLVWLAISYFMEKNYREAAHMLEAAKQIAPDNLLVQQGTKKLAEYQALGEWQER